MKYAIIFVVVLLIAAVLLLPAYGGEIAEPVQHAQTDTQEQSPSFDKALLLRMQTDEGVVEICLYDYLVGVLSAEMPADFPLEALKAQAVAARTFALRQAQVKRHLNCDVCNEATCCQGWQSATGERFSQAVAATDGLVITYQSALIDATYFSCSGNRTEAALAVWGHEVPYLQSVESPGETDAPKYRSEVTLSVGEFKDNLSAAYPKIDLQGSPESWFGKISYTKGGGIETAVIGGVNIEGTSLRKLFSLTSTDITFQVESQRIVIISHGFGHRVGLSQYGAKAMAEEGRIFTEILTHYYQNVEIQRLCKEKTPLPLSEEVFRLSKNFNFVIARFAQANRGNLKLSIFTLFR